MSCYLLTFLKKYKTCLCFYRNPDLTVQFNSLRPLFRYQNCFLSSAGFCLGYLSGKASPPKILLSLWYIGNYTGKIIQTRQGHWTQCNISQNCVSKCTRLYLSTNSFQKISGDLVPGPRRKLVAFSHSGLLPQKINPR